MQEEPKIVEWYKTVFTIILVILLIPIIPFILWIIVNSYLTVTILKDDSLEILGKISGCAIVWILSTCLLGLVV